MIFKLDIIWMKMELMKNRKYLRKKNSRKVLVSNTKQILRRV